MNMSIEKHLRIIVEVAITLSLLYHVGLSFIYGQYILALVIYFLFKIWVYLVKGEKFI